MSIPRAVYEIARDRDLTVLAAAIAYYALVSTLPLAILAITLAAILGGPALADRVTLLLGEYLSASGQDLLRRTLIGAAPRGPASAVSLAVLAWSGSKLFRGFDVAFDRIGGVETSPSLARSVVDTVVAGAAITLAAVLVVTSGVALSMVPAGGPLLDLFGTIATLCALTVAFLPLYVVLGPARVSILAALPGAGVAAVGWVGLQVGFRTYAAFVGQAGAYGLFGSVLLFVTWLYVASVIVLLGATVTVVVREHHPRWRALPGVGSRR